MFVGHTHVVFSIVGSGTHPAENGPHVPHDWLYFLVFQQEVYISLNRKFITSFNRKSLGRAA